MFLYGILLHNPPPLQAIKHQPYSISKHIEMIYEKMTQHSLEKNLPSWFEDHIDQKCLKHIIKKFNNNTQMNQANLLRDTRVNPISNLTIINKQKPNYLLDMKEIIDNQIQQQYKKKFNADLNNKSDQNYTPKCPKTYSFWVNNLIPGSEHKVRTIENYTPSLVKGWRLLHLVRIDAYPYTHRWASAKSLPAKCIGCKSTEHFEDAHHLLTSCPAWSTQRANSFRVARNMTHDQPQIKSIINNLRQNITISNNNNNNNNNISIYDDKYASGELAHEWLSSKSLSYILSGTTSTSQFEEDIKIHQPIIWIWLAMFLQSIEDDRHQLLSATGARY